MEIKVEKKRNKSGKNREMSLLLSIILVFCILGGVVFSVSRRITGEMSASAIHNLSESLALIKGTVEAVLVKEAEFQKMIAQEILTTDNPEAFLSASSYKKNRTMVKLSVILSGKTE